MRSRARHPAITERELEAQLRRMQAPSPRETKTIGLESAVEDLATWVRLPGMPCAPSGATLWNTCLPWI